MSPPPAPPKRALMKSRKQDASRDAADDFGADEEKEMAPGIDVSPYETRLKSLADELARAATAVVPNSAAQLPIARLAELLEDLKTVGLDDMAKKLAPIVDRLRGALVTGDLVAVLGEAATALRALAVGGPGGPTPTRKKGWAFWR
jgi:hypothetical protein